MCSRVYVEMYIKSVKIKIFYILQYKMKLSSKKSPKTSKTDYSESVLYIIILLIFLGVLYYFNRDEKDEKKNVSESPRKDATKSIDDEKLSVFVESFNNNNLNSRMPEMRLMYFTNQISKGKQPTCFYNENDHAKNYINKIFITFEAFNYAETLTDIAILFLLFNINDNIKVKYNKENGTFNFIEQITINNTGKRELFENDLTVYDLAYYFFIDKIIQPYSTEQKSFIESINPVISKSITSAQAYYYKVDKDSKGMPTTLDNRIEDYKNKSKSDGIKDIPLQVLADFMISYIANFNFFVFRNEDRMNIFKNFYDCKGPRRNASPTPTPSVTPSVTPTAVSN
jgi:hypothetical protein